MGRPLLELRKCWAISRCVIGSTLSRLSGMKESKGAACKGVLAFHAIIHLNIVRRGNVNG